MEQEHLKLLEMGMGPGVQTLLQSQEATEAHIDDADPRMRFAALTLMTYHWGPTEEFQKRCEDMAFHDPDAKVRSRAIGCLGACFHDTDNRRLERLLADIVCNESATYAQRRAAYVALFEISGANMPWVEVIANLRIPEDIDWAFVESFRQANEAE
jgi:hypothetical protein